jgi:hypothetical protein
MRKILLAVLFMVGLVAAGDTTWCMNIGSKQIGSTNWTDSMEVCRLDQCRWVKFNMGVLLLKDGNSTVSYVYQGGMACNLVAVDWDSSRIWLFHNDFIRFDFGLHVIDTLPFNSANFGRYIEIQNTSIRTNQPSIHRTPSKSNSANFDLRGRILKNVPKTQNRNIVVGK